MTKICVICNFQKKPVLGANLCDQKRKMRRHIKTTLQIFHAFLLQHIYTPTLLSMTRINKKAASAKGQR